MSEAQDRRHRQAQHRLAQAVSSALGAVLVSLEEPESQEAMDRYSSEALLIVGGGQRKAAGFALAYVAGLSRPSGRGLPPSVERALEGKAVGSESPVVRSPVLHLWGRLAEGEELPLARQSAASYAGGLASGDLQTAERGGLEEGARAGERPLKGWSKELSAGACEWCREVARQVYRSSDSVPFHQRDRCAVAPVFDD